MVDKSKEYRRLLREVHGRLLLMQGLADRHLMDYGQMQVGLGKTIRMLSEIFAREEAQDEHEGERKQE